MAVRTVIYNLKATDTVPEALMWGGVQYEDNATEVRYNLENDLFQSLLSYVADNLRIRIDFNSASAGYDPSENYPFKSTISRSIPRKFTQYGGQMTATLVISLLDSEDSTKAVTEILSIPCAIFFTSAKRQSKRVYENLSAFEEFVIAKADQAKLYVENVSGTAQEILISVEEAKNHAEEAKAQVEIIREIISGFVDVSEVGR